MMPSQRVRIPLLILTVGFSSALGQLPDGFEIVDVSFSPTLYHDRPSLNDCGQIAFNMWNFDNPVESEVFLYDNGVTRQITDSQNRSGQPKINASGVLVWMGGSQPIGVGQVLRYEHGTLTVMADYPGGLQAIVQAINAPGHMSWMLWDSQPCPSTSAIVFHDGITERIVIDDGLQNQSSRLNDNDDLIWVRYDRTCGSPVWSSQILLLTGDQIEVLPTTRDTPQAPRINNLGEAVWSYFNLVDFWDGENVSELTNGHVADINDSGEIAFSRKVDAFSFWQIWLLSNGTFYQITDDAMHHNGQVDINEFGEIAWWWFPGGTDLVPSGVRYMRRMRTGDTDFDDAIGASDFTQMPGCLSGPHDTDRLCDCRFYDMDHDRDVDLRDVAAFQVRFGLADAHLDYCHAHGEPGTNDPAIAACVCEAFPFCCTTTTGWGQFCVDAVEAMGCGRCGE